MPDRNVVTYLIVSVAIMMATVVVTPQTPARTFAITHVSVVDVTDGRIVPNSTVTITGDTITSVAQSGALPADAQVVDGQGKFLIPGLWDMHAHIQGNEKAWLPVPFSISTRFRAPRDGGSRAFRFDETRADTAGLRPSPHLPAAQSP